MSSVKNLAYLISFIFVESFVIFCVIKKPVIKIPKSKYSFKVRYSLIPLFATIVLSLSGLLNSSTIKIGILGDSTIQPYEIVLIFISLSYICMALDQTGVLAYISYIMINKAAQKGSSNLVFFSIFSLSAFFTLFTSNDVVILTLTQIVYYFTYLLEVDPLPFLYIEFFSANLWSASFYISNTTNIIVGQAFSIKFLTFSVYSALPTIVNGIVVYAILYYYFYKDLQKVERQLKERLSKKNVNDKFQPKQLLLSPINAYVAGFILIVCLILLATTQWTLLPLWTISFGFAILLAFLLAISDVFERNKPIPKHSNENKEPAALIEVTEPEGDFEDGADCNMDDDLGINAIPLELGTSQETIGVIPPMSSQESLLPVHIDQEMINHNINTQEIEHKHKIPNIAEETTTTEQDRNKTNVEDSNSNKNLLSNFIERHACTKPLPVLPWMSCVYIIPMYILVEGLADHHWIDKFASFFHDIIESNAPSASLSFIVSIISFMVVCLIVCNLISTTPMTILFTRILLSKHLNLDKRSMLGATYSVILASNFGPNITLIGTLAGILYAKILKRKNVIISYSQFAKIGILVSLPAVILSTLILGIEVYCF